MFWIFLHKFLNVFENKKVSFREAQDGECEDVSSWKWKSFRHRNESRLLRNSNLQLARSRIHNISINHSILVQRPFLLVSMMKKYELCLAAVAVLLTQKKKMRFTFEILITFRPWLAAEEVELSYCNFSSLFSILRRCLRVVDGVGRGQDQPTTCWEN